jgi:hypothetical protein
MALGYELRLGAMTVSSDERQSQASLLRLRCELRMDGAGSHATIELGVCQQAPPSAGDPVAISLSAGQGSQLVFTGQVGEVEVSPSRLVVRARCGLAQLAQLSVESAYQQVPAGFIVKDLLSRAGVLPGDIEDGPSFPAYALFRGPRALGHLLRLAALSGVEVFADSNNRVHFAAPRSGPPDHTLRYGQDVLDVDLSAVTPSYDGVVVYGEGAASTQGNDKAHVLLTDLASVKGEAQGARSLLVVDGAIRSGQDAAKVARAQQQLVTSRPVRGTITVLPAPQVQLGDLCRLDGVPVAHPAAQAVAGRALRARSVRHELGLAPSQGFTTRIGF